MYSFAMLTLSLLAVSSINMLGVVGRETRAVDMNRWQSSTSGEGTPSDLKRTFVSRCEERKCSERINCNELWKQFNESFAYKEPCLSPESYADYCDAAMYPTPMDKTLFWSGTREQAHEASKTCNFVTLEDTLLGYTLNGLTWCGEAMSPGINETQCQSDYECMRQGSGIYSAARAYWAQASITFAQEATGVAFIMLDGSRTGGAFKESSIFAQFELPNLQQDSVTMVHILMVYSGIRNETCDTGATIQILREKIEDRGFLSECTDFEDFVPDRVDDVTDKSCYCGASYPVMSIFCLVLLVLIQTLLSQV